MRLSELTARTDATRAPTRTRCAEVRCGVGAYFGALGGNNPPTLSSIASKGLIRATAVSS